MRTCSCCLGLSSRERCRFCNEGLPLLNSTISVVDVNEATFGRENWSSYLSVKHILVSFPPYRHLNIGSITRGNLGLRHQERRPNLALQQRVQPLPLLCFGAVFRQHLHIASIRGRTVGSLPTLLANVPSVPPSSTFPLPNSSFAPHTSDAVMLFPRYSAISPYSKLLNPAPSVKWFLGRNIFQIPSFFALVLSSSMMDGCASKRSTGVWPIWRWNTASAGMHSSSTNFSTYIATSVSI